MVIKTGILAEAGGGIVAILAAKRMSQMVLV
jgi:hypothetical protein